MAAVSQRVREYPKDPEIDLLGSSDTVTVHDHDYGAHYEPTHLIIPIPISITANLITSSPSTDSLQQTLLVTGVGVSVASSDTLLMTHR